MELKETLLMPKTAFEMRANLAGKEPIMLKKWDDGHLYEKMNENRIDCPEYMLHDGPPYANGNMHCGHMLNRLLKDFTVRYKNMMGYKTPFIFGWDTHGLPIEVQLTKNGVDRKSMDVADFRELCRQYALKQVDRQKEQIHRLGVLGDYQHPYMTMLPEYESRQLDVFVKMALKGLIFKGVKPVYWSPSSESALAEAEIEYKDIPAKTMYVSFDVADGKGLVPNEAKIIIWTTTPWTIPANLAITLNPRFEYGLFATEKGQFIFLASLKDKLQAELGFAECELVKTFKGQELEYATVHHPIYNRLSTVIVANFVDEESGTGCVHTAPDHGLDDFNACLKYGIKPFCPVDEKGVLRLKEGDPLNGVFYEKANDMVVDMLRANGHLLKEIDIVHSYPHDWRTKKPVIFRATPQWFCSIEPIREQLLEAVHKIKWYPAWGEAKMVNMIKDRADWCISRQRAWGVPIPVIYNEDGSPIMEKAVFDNIEAIIRKEGSSAWFRHSAAELLPEGYANAKSPNGRFSKETDIMDVWFDSGSSWNGVLRERGLKYPADLYLEGNDQYRGWFNASLILSVAYSGVAPFSTCVTNGWVMDENWQKMSKSAGNGIDPSKIANQFGADILRLWAASIDYQQDSRISEGIIGQVSENYRKIRNTFKFLLGNLQDGEKPYEQPVSAPKLSLVDEYVLAQLEETKNKVLADYETFSFAGVSNLVLNFMIDDLSSFYLDLVKDVMYCEAADSPRRKAVQYVLYKVAWELCLLLNPILSFTMDEVYHAIPGPKKDSPQLEDMPKTSHEYKKDVLVSYGSFRNLRSVVLKALEDSRAKGEIGSPQEAAVVIACPDEKLVKALRSLPFEELARLFVVSQATVSKGKEAAVVSHADGEKCPRCWNYRTSLVEEDGQRVCPRCAAVLKGFANEKK